MARTSKSKPPKKSRIVSSADNSTTLTCTHNNAHRLAQMRAVVLRTTLTAGRRRLGQSSTHGEMEVEEDVGEDEPTPIDEVFTMDFAQDIESDESDSEDEDMGPKRPPVSTSILSCSAAMFSISFRSRVLAKTSFRTAKHILTSSFVMMASSTATNVSPAA